MFGSEGGGVVGVEGETKGFETGDVGPWGWGGSDLMMGGSLFRFGGVLGDGV